MKSGDAPLINRELSLLAFNRRVLALAEDPALPLLERLRFLCIVSGNLDEFFEIRVAGLREQLRAKQPLKAGSVHDLREVYIAISADVHRLVADMYRILNQQILPALGAANIRLLRGAQRTEAQRAWLADYFQREVRPLLTPIGLEPAHPFPQVVNKSLNFVVELSGFDAFGRETAIAIVKAPRVLPRVIQLPSELVEGGRGLVLLSSIIHAHLHELFPHRQLLSYSQFRVTRDVDLWFDEEEVKNLRQALELELPQRQFGLAVRLEVAASCPPHLAEFLLQQFDLQETDLYRCEGPVNLARMQSFIDEADMASLKYPPLFPDLPDRLKDGVDIFAVLRQHDVLLHHPFQPFDPVIDFIRGAALDPEIVAIKQTVYRAGADSALMEALTEAARRGKEVTVVVELLARFDEEANMEWAETLQQAGAQVVYGVFGLKTHAKLALIYRRETDVTGTRRLQPYAHLATGNYNARTARLYTDFSLLTTHADVCSDVNEVFMHITSLSKAARLKHLWLAPFTMHKQVLESIRREARNAAAGKPARIVAKMNALIEEAVIRALYAASQAGVSIDLIVRGACALCPGVKGVSDNIRVRSVLGRFLEHSRIWYFENNGQKDVYLASADWMGRNLFRRIEVAFPVIDRELKERVVREGLEPYLQATRDVWELQPSGEYLRVNSAAETRKDAKPGASKSRHDVGRKFKAKGKAKAPPLSAQDALLSQLTGRSAPR